MIVKSQVSCTASVLQRQLEVLLNGLQLPEAASGGAPYLGHLGGDGEAGGFAPDAQHWDQQLQRQEAEGASGSGKMAWHG